MSSGRKDLCSGIFYLLFAAFLYVQSFAIKMSTADALGPQFFPRLVVIFMVLLAFILIVRAVAAIRREGPNTAKGPVLSWNTPLMETVGLLIAYFFLLKPVGYIVLTAVYLFCQMLILLPKDSVRNKKRLAIAAATSILTPTCIYLLFYKGFMIFLPAGILG